MRCLRLSGELNVCAYVRAEVVVEEEEVVEVEVEEKRKPRGGGRCLVAGPRQGPMATVDQHCHQQPGLRSICTTIKPALGPYQDKTELITLKQDAENKRHCSLWRSPPGCSANRQISFDSMTTATILEI